MKQATEYLWFETAHRRDYVNITAQVEEVVRRSGIRHGLVLVNPMHITAAVYVNDDESDWSPISTTGWSGSPHTSPSPPTATTLARTTPMRTSSGS